MTNIDNNNHHLLLVDDERIVLASMGIGLSKAGYTISTAESVDEAEALLMSNPPDMVILDVNMPGKSGLDLAERLYTFDEIPFMLLTAYNDQELVDCATKLGALGYLVKPVSTRQMVPAIDAALVRAAEIKSLRSTGRQLQNLLNDDREISVAIGITMVKCSLDRKASFERLRTAARRQQRTLKELATEIILSSEMLNGDNLKKPH